MNTIQPSFILPQREATPSLQPVFAKKLYDKFDHIWSYLGKIALLTRQGLNITLKTCHYISLCCRTSASIQRVIARLKLLSIVGVPFTASSIQATAEKVFKGYRNGDRATLTLGSLSLVILSTDLVDSLATFTNAVNSFLGKAPVQFLSAIGMPVAFGLVTMGGLSRTIQLVNTARFYRQLGNAQREEKELSPQLKRLLIEKMGVTETELALLINSSSNSSSRESEVKKLLEKKRAALQRQAPSAAIKELEKLVSLLSDPQISQQNRDQEIKASLVKIAASLKKKMVVDAGNLAANILSFIALCLFFTAAPAVLPFILLASSFTLRLGFLAYQDFA